ncbi:MAG: peptidoglycan DD-metalloendopeptidase family protein [Proteobacteria bacterium]|nr:peptidoglycan DD-metalloendopeptidase family protein [Pseudomonadota bacterium]
MKSPRLVMVLSLLIAATLIMSATPSIAAETDGPPPGAEPQAVPDGTTVDLEDVFDPTDPEQIFREIVYPVVGSSTYSAGFGACRDGCARSHNGIDILLHGWKGVPIVAAHDGTITSTRTGGELSGCSVEIQADDGWRTRYIHLNTDTPGTDDGESACFAPNIEVGARVAAGTLIGWSGDSGNAEHTVPNLHFEIRNPDDIPVDPWISLEAARRIDHRWIEPGSVLGLTTELTSSSASTVLVVETSNIADLTRGDEGPALIDIPLIAYDRQNPALALQVLSDLAPQRIIVIGDEDDQRMVAALQPYADLVALALLPDLIVEDEPPQDAIPDAQVTLPGDTDVEDEPVDEPESMVFDSQEEDRFTTLIVGRADIIVPELQEQIDHYGLEHKIVLISTARRAPSKVDSPAWTQPGADANRDFLWWNTARGWLISDTLENAPEPGLAYLAVGVLDAPLVAYVMSQTTAPAMPLWHYQPTSRAIRAL